MKEIWCGCQDVEKYLGLKWICCMSCHDDEWEGYADLLQDEFKIDNEHEFILSHCCTCPKLTPEQFKKLGEALIEERREDAE